MVVGESFICAPSHIINPLFKLYKYVPGIYTKKNSDANSAVEERERERERERGGMGDERERERERESEREREVLTIRFTRFCFENDVESC